MIKPLGDKIIVERIEQGSKTAGGIIIPDTAKEKPKQAKVIAVGPGARDENGKRKPVDVEVGDIILFTQWSGSEIKHENTEFLVLKECDVIAIMGKSNA